MRRLLLIADMEGVAGIDRLGQVIAGTAEYEAACALLTAEVNAAVAGFIEAGYDEILVSDSHRGGAAGSNVIAQRLHPRARLTWSGDAYAAGLFSEVDAVACIGMHARAGTQGFIAHTVNIHCEWRHDGAPLSETGIVMALAGEAGIPMAFVAGDDVLCAELNGRVALVETKASLNPLQSRSLDPVQVCVSLREAAAGAVPGAQPKPVPGAVEICFKSRWQADWAQRLGAHRRSVYGVRIEGANFRACYERAEQLVEATVGPVIAAVRGAPGSETLLEDAAEVISRPIPDIDGEREPLTTGDIAGTCAAFLRWTEAPSDFSRALRALILHMMEAWAPEAFAHLRLRPVLHDAVAALGHVPMRLAPDVRHFDGMSRVDAWYILRERGLPCEGPDPEDLQQYLEHMRATGFDTHAWLLGEMAAAHGIDVRLPYGPRPFRTHSRLLDLYWLAHEFLFATHYLHQPLAMNGRESYVEELFMAVPWLIDRGHVDLAAEVALCLQMAGEHAAPRHRELVEFLLRCQRDDGVLMDGSMGDPPEIMADHATGLLLLVQAGAQEWNRRLAEGETEYGGRSAEGGSA